MCVSITTVGGAGAFSALLRNRGGQGMNPALAAAMMNPDGPGISGACFVTSLLSSFYADYI